jgi:hypothetical protein
MKSMFQRTFIQGILLSAVASFTAVNAVQYNRTITYSYSGASAGGTGRGTTNMTFTWNGASAGTQNSTGKTIFNFYNAGPNGVPAYVTIDTTPLAYGSGYSMRSFVPVYVLYYTAASNFYNNNTVGYFNSAKQQVIADFINGLTASKYFSTVRQYNRGGTPGNVYLAGSYVMDCNRDIWSKGCDLTTDNTDEIIDSVTQAGKWSCQKPTQSGVWCNPTVESCFCGLPRDGNAIYVLLLGPETTEAFANNGTGAKIGTDYCAYHTYYPRGETKQKYIVAQVPNSASISMPSSVMVSTSIKPPSACFFRGVNSNSDSSPNGDPQLDYVIGHLAHEIIETLVSPVAREVYSDSNGNEVMDK